MQFSQRQRRQQAERVQMAAMVRHDYEGTISAEIFVTDDFETMINTQ